MAEAKDRYVQHIRWEAFEQRSHDWHAVTRHREFLASVRATIDGRPGPERETVAVQLDFAERRLDQIDPIRHLELLLPEIPDPKPDDLKPYLDGWSPYGPEPSANPARASLSRQ
jgi:hypothetical protein